MGKFLIAISIFAMIFIAGSAMAEENSGSFNYTEAMFQEGLKLMEEIEKTCPVETDDEEEYSLCRTLRIFVEETGDRMVENFSNMDVFLRLHKIKEAAEKILASDCCLIERNLNSPPPNQNWAESFKKAREALERGERPSADK